MDPEQVDWQSEEFEQYDDLYYWRRTRRFNCWKAAERATARMIAPNSPDGVASKFRYDRRPYLNIMADRVIDWDWKK